MRRNEIRKLRRRVRSLEATVLRQSIQIEALAANYRYFADQLAEARIALGLDELPSLPALHLRLVGGTEANKTQEEGR